MNSRKKIINELRFQLDSKEVKDQHYPIQLSASDADTILALLKEPEWISVKDRPPKSGKHVLAACEIRLLNGSKKQYVCEAYHAEEHSISEGKFPDDTDCYDYSEEDDEYYLKEGWYEVIHNWDEYGSVVINDFVTRWMPMPELPNEEGEM